MELDVVGLDDAREAWRTGHQDEVRDVALSSITLGATVEAACWGATGDPGSRAVLEQWAALSPTVRIALLALTTSDDLPRPGEHDAPTRELRRCPSRAELVDADVGTEWRYFLDRFRRSLTTRHGRLATARARGLSAALHEMVDNVVEHAGLGDAPVGVVAYDVSDQHFGFAVADLGRGVLRSLRENSAHAGLLTDADALLSAVTRGASRRPGVDGKGFSDLLRALADLEGTLSFRSGSARLRLDGRGSGSRVVSRSNSPVMNGFQLSIVAEPAKSAW
jgi:hypothetical protein